MGKCNAMAYIIIVLLLEEKLNIIYNISKINFAMYNIIYKTTSSKKKKKKNTRMRVCVQIEHGMPQLTRVYILAQNSAQDPLPRSFTKV